MDWDGEIVDVVHFCGRELTDAIMDIIASFRVEIGFKVGFETVLSRFLVGFCLIFAFFAFEETVLEELYVYFTDKVNGFILQTCSELNFYCLGVEKQRM